MSFIPKYILRRLFPKDCLKLVEGGIEVVFNNIVSPMKVEEIPEDFFSQYSVTIDGQSIPKDMMEQAKITINGKVYTKENIADLSGEIVPVGGVIKIFAPFTELAGKKVEKGDEHEFHVHITIPSGGSADYGPLKRVVQ
ncbi:MAG: hypothetical protein ACTSUE_17435 [Promethearchaeota archaeon]